MEGMCMRDGGGTEVKQRKRDALRIMRETREGGKTTPRKRGDVKTRERQGGMQRARDADLLLDEVKN